MNTLDTNIPQALHLRVGDVVEVRRPSEILATLGEGNTLDSLPFMPEMLQYCGRRFRVYRRAHKSCDVIQGDGICRVDNAVFLEELRCDGEAHGECQAACLIFWKEAWLKKVPPSEAKNFRPSKASSQIDVPLASMVDSEMRQAYARLMKSTQVQQGTDSPNFIRYSCQATEMRRASKPLPWWDVRQYWQDWRSGNVPIAALIRAGAIFVFNELQQYRQGGKYPFIEGALSQTPRVILNVQPGELVRLKPKDEILKTLDRRNRNRGLSFDRELVKFCGGTYRVARRVEREVNNKTGELMNFHTDCIVLDGVVCEGDYNRFCQRRIYHYVRESWLERVEAPGQSVGKQAACQQGSCEESENVDAVHAANSLSEN